MEYLVEPMQFSGSVCKSAGGGSGDGCECNGGTLITCGCQGVKVDPCTVDICNCQGGREGCCGLGGRTPPLRSVI